MKGVYMKFNGWWILLSGMLVAALAMLVGCGSGGGTGGASGAKIEITPTKTSVPAGTSFPVNIKISGDAPFNGVKTEVESDNSSTIAKQSATTNAAGEASVNLYVKELVNKNQTVNIRARLKDSNVYSSWQTLEILPSTLTISEPEDINESITSVADVCGGTLHTVIKNAKVVFKDAKSDGIAGKQIDFKLQSVSNPDGFDKVIFDMGPETSDKVTIDKNNYGSTKVTVTTDSNGEYLFPMTIAATVPPVKDAKNVFVLTWSATVKKDGDDGVSITYDTTKQTMVTVECK